MLAPRFVKAAPAKSDYVVIAEAQNLHIAGRKVLKGDTIALTTAEAAHWLSEGVIAPAPVTATTTTAKSAE